mmetsp:Transcript_86870/g.254257  ORF Transcript_86870/g.254257 Transcript_86870/m.254257 type:complete len:212 (-) Transcript_86870:981-1616(-)
MASMQATPVSPPSASAARTREQTSSRPRRRGRTRRGSWTGRRWITSRSLAPTTWAPCTTSMEDACPAPPPGSTSTSSTARTRSGTSSRATTTTAASTRATTSWSPGTRTRRTLCPRAPSSSWAAGTSSRRRTRWSRTRMRRTPGRSWWLWARPGASGSTCASTTASTSASTPSSRTGPCWRGAWAPTSTAWACTGSWTGGTRRCLQGRSTR